MIQWIIIGLLVIIIIIGALFIFRPSDNNRSADKGGDMKGLPAPDFLSVEEKARFDISPDTKVQSLQRGPNGETMVYKIIYDDSEIITDPSSVGPISPRYSEE